MLLQFMKKFLRRDIGDRSLSEVCPHKFHKPAHLLQRRLSQPLTRFLLYQFLGHASEAVAGPNARLNAGLSFGYVGIDRMSQLPTGGIPGSARLGQGNLGIRPDRQFPFYAVDPVFDSPQLAASWIDEQIQTLGVSNLVRLICGLGIADSGIG